MMLDALGPETFCFIHNSADVEPGAVIGKGVKIWRNTHVRETAEIGDGTTIGQCCYIEAKIGAGCKIQNSVNLYQGATIGNEVFIGPCATFTNDIYPRAVGDWEITETIVEDGASIGANATIVAGVTIGANAMVGAGAVVSKDVPPGDTVAGVPAESIRRSNVPDVATSLVDYLKTRAPKYKARKDELLRQVIEAFHTATFDQYSLLYDGMFSLMWQQMDDFVDTQYEIESRLIKPALRLFSEHPLPGGDKVAWVLNNATVGMYAPFKHVQGYLMGMQPCILFIVGGYDSGALDALKAAGHTVYIVGGSPEEKIQNIRATCEAQQVGVLIADIYLSIPLALFAMRTAPIQLYLSPGFQCFPADVVLLPETQEPLHDRCVKIPTVLLPMLAKPRKQPGKIVFGCLSRYEKMSSDYFDMVIDVLNKVPGSEFHAYGRGELVCPDDDRIVNKGFAHAFDALSEIDVYLDTYPVCGGVSVWESMAAGVPVVTLNHASTESWNNIKPLVVHSEEGWVSASIQLIEKKSFYDAIAKRGQEEIEKITNVKQAGEALDKIISDLRQQV